MHQVLLVLHSMLRWLVLLSLIWSICAAWKGMKNKKEFGKKVNLLRHWTATIAHIQLVTGILVYTKSPMIKYFWKHFSEEKMNIETAFFPLIHIFLMLFAIVVITIGSSMAKRKNNASDKYKTMLMWFAAALVIILVAIPWPFSPLAARPYFR